VPAGCSPHLRQAGVRARSPHLQAAGRDRRAASAESYRFASSQPPSHRPHPITVARTGSGWAGLLLPFVSIGRAIGRIVQGSFLAPAVCALLLDDQDLCITSRWLSNLLDLKSALESHQSVHVSMAHKAPCKQVSN
jgi:hypothetical protein